MEFALIDVRSHRDWQEWDAHNVELSGDGVSLKRSPKPLAPEILGGDEPAFEAVDIDVDDCGDPYALDSSGEIYRYDRESRSWRRLSCLWYDEERDGRPVALCVTEQDLYVATVRDGSEPGGSIHAFSRHLLQTRWVESVSGRRPTAFATYGKRIYLLDDTGSILRIRSSGWMTELRKISGSPKDIAIDGDGNLHVLVAERTPTGKDEIVIRRIGPVESSDSATASTSHEERLDARIGDPSVLVVTSDGRTFVGTQSRTAESDEGEGGLFYRRSLEDDFEALPGFEEGCSRAVAHPKRSTETDGLYAICDGSTRVFVVEESAANALNDRTSQYDAQLVNRFDSGVFGNEWHRVRTGVTLGGAGTQVRLSYLATDDDDEGALEEIVGIGPTYADRLEAAGIESVAELAELSPEPLARAANASPNQAERWIEQATSLRPGDWRTLSDPRDGLLEAATGRYLWIKLELLGNEQSSPRVSSLRAYFSRQSYLRYLPAIYREDEESAAFLERFLSIFESVFVDIEEEIEGLTSYLDPYGIPSEYVPWLEGWLSLVADETWTESSRRRLIDEAPDLFKKRGTREGLLRTLELYFGLDQSTDPSRSGEDSRRSNDVAPRGPIDGGERDPAVSSVTSSEIEEWGIRLLEHPDLDCADETEALEPFMELLGDPRRFLVLVGPGATDQQMRTADQIVRSEQPAHTVGEVTRLEPWIRLGANAYLEVNSYLPERDLIMGRSSLGKDTVLSERESYAQLEVKSKISEDSLIS